MITINGINSEVLGVTFLQGFIENLLKLPSTKEAVTNTSRNINGVQIDARNTRVEKRSVALSIRLKGSSEEDYLDKYEALQKLLIAGKDGTGIVELGYSRYIFKLRFESCDSLRNLAPNIGNLSLSFLEPNPLDRA